MHLHERRRQTCERCVRIGDLERWDILRRKKREEKRTFRTKNVCGENVLAHISTLSTMHWSRPKLIERKLRCVNAYRKWNENARVRRIRRRYRYRFCFTARIVTIPFDSMKKKGASTDCECSRNVEHVISSVAFRIDVAHGRVCMTQPRRPSNRKSISDCRFHEW